MTSQDVPSFHEKEEHEGDTVPFSDCPLLNQALTVAKSGENNPRIVVQPALGVNATKEKAVGPPVKFHEPE